MPADMTPYPLRLALLFILWPSHCIQDFERHTAMSNILDPKIAGGVDAPKGRFPYMCSLRKRGSQEHMCGGTLIQKTWVLTAAHCLMNKAGRALGYYPIVDCGIYHVDIVADHLTFATIDSHVHRDWNGDVDDGFDIAMLKLNREAELISPQIDKKGVLLSQGDYLSAVGWGTTQKADIADVLQMAQRLVYISRNNCERVLDMKLKEHMICAGMLDQDTCRGDSGGPLFLASAPKGKVKKGLPALDLLVGVTSAGRQTEIDGTVVCDASVPGVYTNVSFFWDWISGIIEDGSETVGQGSLWKKEAKELRETYRPLSDDELKLEMVYALQADDPLKADSLLLAGVSANSEYTNYTFLCMPPGSSLLHWAAAYDSLQCVKILLLARAELDGLNDLWETSLYTAASLGSSRVTKYLLDFGAEKDRASREGKTPLHAAAWNGHYHVVKILVEEGVDLEPKDSRGQTPLHLAARNGSAKIVKKLIANNVEVDVRDNREQTPLILAAKGGNLKAVKVLIRAGANASAVDSDGRSPLLSASNSGNLEIVKELVSHAVDIESPDNKGTTPLMVAAEEGHLEIAKELIANEANVSATDNLGKTPLHMAARNGDAEVVKVLLSEGADVHAKTQTGRTPLIEASYYGRFEAVKELLANDADPNAADNSGARPLLEASKYGYVDTVQALEESGADVNATDLQGRTALSLASSSGKVDVVKALLSYGADMDAATRPGGATALHQACTSSRRVEVIKVLIENGVNVDKPNDEGKTALHITSQRGYLEAAKALVEGGADKTIRDGDSETALDVVCSYAYAYCSAETKAALEKLLAL